VNGHPTGDKTFAVLFFLFLTLATVMGLLVTVGRGRRRARLALRLLREDADGFIAYLAARVAALADAPTTDEAGRRAAADASERLDAARALRARADQPAVLRAARRAALEGLAAAYDSARRLGIDPGPEPPPPTPAPMVQAPTAVDVAGARQTAMPAYAPGFAHHFGGGLLAGTAVPGGWYATPFWQPLLLDDDEALPA